MSGREEVTTKREGEYDSITINIRLVKIAKLLTFNEKLMKFHHELN